MTVSPEFELATLEVEKVNGIVPNDDLLVLYGLYKIANGVDFKSAPSPGTFDFVGKAKHAAWKKENEKGLTAAQAQQEYIKVVEAQKNSLGYDAKRTTKADGKPIKPANLERFDALSKQLGKN